MLLEGREVKVVSTALLICIRTVTYIHILFTKTLWFWFSQDYNDFSCFYGSEVCNVGVQRVEYEITRFLYERTSRSIDANFNEIIHIPTPATTATYQILSLQPPPHTSQLCNEPAAVQLRPRPHVTRYISAETRCANRSSSSSSRKINKTSLLSRKIRGMPHMCGSPWYTNYCGKGTYILASASVNDYSVSMDFKRKLVKAYTDNPPL